MTVDPLTLAVVKGAMEEITEEMDWTLKRTAFSPVISEGNDLANGIYDAVTGEVIVQGKWGLALFIGIMQFTTEHVIQEVARRGIEPEDIFFVNDPYSGGTHLMDVGMVKPFYHKGELFAYLANRGHWPDMGGSVPGGFGANSSEVFQEGLRIPPVKLFKRGQLDEDVFKIMMSNIRVAEERTGDLQAHLSAFTVGERRLTNLLDRYGVETVRTCIGSLKQRSERQMRSYLEEIPDGTYEYEDFMDSDGIEDRPLRIALKLTIEGSEALLDFSNSSPPCRGPMSSVISATKSACYLAFKHVFPEIPVNSGCFSPLQFQIPDSTFLNARLPRPVAGCASEVSQRVGDVVMGALGQAIPERVSAGIFGTISNLSIGGMDREVGDYVMYMFNGGGYGGHTGGDGLSYGSPIISVARSQPVELYEQRYPVRIRKFALREESAGAGKHRGGFGAVIETEFVRGEGTASIIGDRGKFAPRGIEGGEDGEKCHIEFIRGGEKYVSPHLTKDSNIRMEPGDVVRLFTPGGGGYGDPLERDPALVLDDVRNGFISTTSGVDEYGVVIVRDSMEVDAAATQLERRKRRSPNASD